MVRATLLAVRNAELARLLHLTPGQDVEPLLNRALPIINNRDSHGESVLLRYYGLRGHDPSYLTAIGNDLKLKDWEVGRIVNVASNVLREVHQTMECEHTAPHDCQSWQPEAFFTTERGIQAKLEMRMTVRICNAMRREGLSSVGELCEHDEDWVRRIPGIGARGVIGIKAMLATAGLALAEDD